MVSCSQYLLLPLRNLRKACREIAAIHPEAAIRDCDACAHAPLCAVYEQIERGRRNQLTAVLDVRLSEQIFIPGS